ncbi:uncharacterized protein VTP21DRAFT_3644 [Calcarisporiella thermophila]|uniref:uncharacterized protein n=1 Tax=Calcarisporiella thermophila TaxID=911321 RepID=UPI0037427D89
MHKPAPEPLPRHLLTAFSNPLVSLSHLAALNHDHSHYMSSSSTLALAIQLNDPYVTNLVQARELSRIAEFLDGRTLNWKAIASIAKHTLSQWEPWSASPDGHHHGLCHLLRSLLHYTPTHLIHPNPLHSPDNSHSPMPASCPTAILLLAVSYLDKLKSKYPAAQGAMGCTQRLVLIAYIIAFKYFYFYFRVHNPSSSSSNSPSSSLSYSSIYRDIDAQWHLNTAYRFSLLVPGSPSVASLLKLERTLLGFIDWKLEVEAEEILGFLEVCCGAVRVVPSEKTEKRWQDGIFEKSEHENEWEVPEFGEELSS